MSEIKKKYEKGLQLVQLNKFDEAEQYYRKIEDEINNYSKDFSAMFIRDKISPIKGKRDYAISELANIAQVRIEIPIMIGKILFHAQKYKATLEYLTQRVKYFPDNLQLHHVLWNIYQNLNKIEEGEIFFQDLRKNHPLKLGPDEMLAEIYLSQSKVELADPIIEKILKHFPQRVEAWNFRGVSCSLKKDLDGAESAFRKLTHINPKSDLGWDNLGNILMQKQNYMDAKSCFEKAITLNSNNLKSWYNLAALHKQQGFLKESILYFKTCIKINPKSFPILKEYADTLEMMGDLTTLKTIYEKIMQLNLSEDILNEIKNKMKAI